MSEGMFQSIEFDDVKEHDCFLDISLDDIRREATRLG